MSPGILILVIASITALNLMGFGEAWHTYDRVRATTKRNRVELTAKGYALVSAILTTALAATLYPQNSAQGMLATSLLCFCVLCMACGFIFSRHMLSESRKARAQLRVVTS